ncbi:hypothetical protein JJB74_05255 [Noviherbaspirillum sp. DKR-6]|uniref:MotA/TolQ/ExbB proton channel domain-containing protein n=2 Tax=Noviherbaspirillum pedocola TaxID=2801341 RepID=A0A934SRN0_9BURK|nr:hypothetical protein [Noviherbaspirillum pedocola]
MPVASAAPDTLFHAWLAFAGVLLFAAALLWQTGVWAMLADADPTGITLLIIAVFTGSTAWCGMRCRALCRERAQLNAWRRASIAPEHGGSIDAYLRDLAAPDADASSRTALAEVLAERLHGPSDTAWWVNGIQIKLGLLGKVIGFSILAMQLSRIENFDPAQTQHLLKTLTGGLGIALLTTAVGLVANMLLGLQLTRIDRCCDGLIADAMQFAETGGNGRNA